jgi:hypothetical protein
MAAFTTISIHSIGHIGRALIWALVGAGFAGAVGVWAGLWFGGYQVLRHDEFARFWPALSTCVGWAAGSGALTGLLTYLADGTNPFEASAPSSQESESFADRLRNKSASRLPASLAARMQLNTLSRAKTAHRV